mgnify:CR=1 FL=1
MRLYELTRKHGSLLIIDDIQVGCGRTGSFFSFENLGFLPDLICLSKSLSAYGLPMSLLLIKPENDIWSPGEHNGTFRGNNLAFIAATEGLNFWRDKNFEESIKEKSVLFDKLLSDSVSKIKNIAVLKGRGMIRGIEFTDNRVARNISVACFNNGLILETAGPEDQVIKLLPPLNIEDKNLEKGMSVLSQCIKEVVASI